MVFMAALASSTERPALYSFPYSLFRIPRRLKPIPSSTDFFEEYLWSASGFGFDKMGAARFSEKDIHWEIVGKGGVMSHEPGSRTNAVRYMFEDVLLSINDENLEFMT